jgi:hypothetical protein
MRGIAKFPDNVSSQRSFHYRVSEIARFDTGPSGNDPVCSTLDPGLGVEHTETFVVLGSDRKHLHSAFLEDVHPRGSIESVGFQVL